MKLPIPERSVARDLAEFDVWITPSLGEIRDTDRFQEELDKVASIFDALSDATDDFSDIAHCSPDAIAATITSRIESLSDEQSVETLHSLASVLFLVTGKSDNNAKCQLPLHLRDVAKWTSFPIVRRRKGKQPTVSSGPIPRELKSDKYMKVVAALQHQSEMQQKLLREFVSFVLSDTNYVSQLWSIGYSYATLKVLSREKHLLTPLVVFQVRGSVSASGGHGPEELLRSTLSEWGLRANAGYNTTDIIVGGNGSNSGSNRSKTRAYDFVLPYQVDGWEPKVLVQCQFYAGDSGSVSHKNVDQTTSSRLAVSAAIHSPKFVEYVDGAGYFSSLNGDLKSILSMHDTQSFFQIRTACIRLRRELQEVGFLTPLEVEHAILRRGGNRTEVAHLLLEEGYAADEIDRAIDDAISHGILTNADKEIGIVPDRLDTVREHFLLDVAAIEGEELAREDIRGSFLIPGYGPFYGLKLDALVEQAAATAPQLAELWQSPQAPLIDIRRLCESGRAMSS